MILVKPLRIKEEEVDIYAQNRQVQIDNSSIAQESLPWRIGSIFRRERKEEADSANV